MRSSALVVRRSAAAPILAAPSLVLLAARATLRSVFHALEQARLLLKLLSKLTGRGRGLRPDRDRDQDQDILSKLKFKRCRPRWGGGFFSRFLNY
ncbi:hypothetical protein PR001_g33562 [Phytophthora rubi]|uniref:Uncharacterized protein n=1 Tax=Phytophthora rubi TaxID=129364 RepID=A0A6A3GCZ3_9STRA|nr:hypothetical protein PR001_g33562 [Phytophthora rubi]